MHENQGVAAMAVDVLARQAGDRAKRTGEPFEEALKSVLEMKTGRQPEELEELHEDPHQDETAQEWQKDLLLKRSQGRAEEKSRVQQAAAWGLFMQAELRELELRKDGQLARLLSEALPGEP